MNIYKIESKVNLALDKKAKDQDTIIRTYNYLKEENLKDYFLRKVENKSDAGIRRTLRQINNMIEATAKNYQQICEKAPDYVKKAQSEELRMLTFNGPQEYTLKGYLDLMKRNTNYLLNCEIVKKLKK